MKSASKLPSAKVAYEADLPIKGFQVQKLFVQVSVVISVADKLFTAKWLSLPLVSAPIPLEFALVPVCLYSK